MYKMVVEITKETWKKCRIKTVKHYNEKKYIIELWQNVALKRIRKYCEKKAKYITEEEKQKCKPIFENEKGIFIIEQLTCDIIERCKLLEAIQPRKKLGYDHDNIMVLKETSIAEKIRKLFSREDIVLNKKINNRKQDIRFKNLNFIVQVDERNYEDYDTDDEKKREDMFKRHNFKIIRCNPNDPEFDINKFLDEINSCVTKL